MDQNQFIAAVKSNPDHTPADHSVLLGLLVVTVAFFLWQQYHGQPTQRARQTAPADQLAARVLAVPAREEKNTARHAPAPDGAENRDAKQGDGAAAAPSRAPRKAPRPRGASSEGPVEPTEDSPEAKAIKYVLRVTVTGKQPPGTVGSGKDPNELTVLLLSRAEGRSLAANHIGDLLLERLSLFGGRHEARLEYLLMCHQRAEKFSEAPPRAVAQDQNVADTVAACQTAAAKSLAHLLHRAAQASPRPEIISKFAKRLVSVPIVGEGVHASLVSSLQGMGGHALGRVYPFIVEELCKLHRKTSMELYSRPLLSTLALLTSIPSVAEVIVGHKKWLVVHPNGKHLEELTLFGEAFAVSSTSQGCISKYFGDHSTGDMSSWEYDMNEIIAALADSIRNMLMHEGSRGGMLRWLGCMVDGNRDGASSPAGTRSEGQSSPSFLAIVFNAAARVSTGAFAMATEGITGDFGQGGLGDLAGDSITVANALNNIVADLAVVSLGPILREQIFLARRSRALKGQAKMPHYTFQRHQHEVATAALSGRAAALRALLGARSLVDVFMKYVSMNSRLVAGVGTAPKGSRHTLFTDLCATVLLMGCRAYGRSAPVINPAEIVPLCRWVCSAVRHNIAEGPPSCVGRWLTALRVHTPAQSCTYCKELKDSAGFYAECLSLLAKMDPLASATVEVIKYCNQISEGLGRILRDSSGVPATDEIATVLVDQVGTHLERVVETARVIALCAGKKLPRTRAIPFQRALAHSAAYVLEASVLLSRLSPASRNLEMLAGLPGWAGLHQRSTPGRIARMHGLNMQLLRELGAVGTTGQRSDTTPL